MDNLLEAPYVPLPQPYPAEPANEAIDQQPRGIGLGGAQVELVQDSLLSCSTPVHQETATLLWLSLNALAVLGHPKTSQDIPGCFRQPEQGGCFLMC
jgi:hypothetical protein